MKFLYLSVLVLCFCPLRATLLTAEALVGLEVDVSTKEAIKNAFEDYEAVLSYKAPLHAKRQNPDIALFDGGTTFWRGVGYSLEIRKTVCAIGSLRYLMYGPVIVFDSKIVRGSEEGRTISCVRIHRYGDLNSKLDEKSPNQTLEPTAPSGRGSP